MKGRIAILSCLVLTALAVSCGKKEETATATVTPKPVETPKSIEEEYIFAKKIDYVEKCEEDLDALEIQLGKIRDHLTNDGKIDLLQMEETIKDLYSRLDYADEVLDRLRMSAADGWKGDQQIVIKAIESLDEACQDVVREFGIPKS